MEANILEKSQIYGQTAESHTVNKWWCAFQHTVLSCLKHCMLKNLRDTRDLNLFDFPMF
jgi:hypothetical protein